MKLGLERRTLENLGYAAFNNAFLDLEAEASEPLDSIKRTEINYEALVIAFAEMIEANNASILSQLKQHGVFDE